MRGLAGGIFRGRGPKANGCRKSLRNNVKEDLQTIVYFEEVVARGGIEPPTQRFSVFRSTTELPGHPIFDLSSAAADY